MAPDLFLSSVLVPGLSWLAETVGPIPPNSREARLLLLAIAGQESGWQNIAQGGGGPGRGPWQFEPETCREILANPASEQMATKVCRALAVVPSRSYLTLLGNPDLAVAFARLDLWCNPAPLPAYDDELGAWDYYIAVWRPGAVAAGGTSAAEARDRWSDVYATALKADKAWEAAQGATV